MSLAPRPSPAGLVLEVKEFLNGLIREFPGMFVRDAGSPPDARAGRKLAREVFARRAEHWSREMGVAYKSVRVKDQRSLWGSCTREGSLNFNWRVVMAPSEVLDYLVIHELAHLLEMNHSRRFWAHVARWSPDYKAHRRWLREHGHKLRGRPGTQPIRFE